MIVAIVVVAIGLLALALVFAVAIEPGPAPADVAVAYELAWDRLDFESLWALSGAELRDGRSRKSFVAAKQDAYRGQAGLGRLAARVAVEEMIGGPQAATVATRLELRDGTTVRNQVGLVLRDGRWQVVAYALPPDAG